MHELSGSRLPILHAPRSDLIENMVLVRLHKSCINHRDSKMHTDRGGKSALWKETDALRFVCYRDFMNPGGLLDKTEDMLGSFLGSGKPTQKATAPPPPPLPIKRDAATDYQVYCKSQHLLVAHVGKFC